MHQLLATALVLGLGSLHPPRLHAPPTEPPADALSAADWSELRSLHAVACFPDDAVAQRAYLKASNTDLGDLLGWSVAISGDTVIVSAIGEDSDADGANGDESDDSAPSSGAIYVYVRDGASWRQQAYLKASNSETIDQFGLSISISGDTIVAGARLEASAATGVDGDETDNSAFRAGAAYVFVRSGENWSQQAYLKASNTESGDQFGYSVSVSGDTIVVGANGEDSAATGIDGDGSDNSAPAAGAAYVFERTGTVWTQVAYLKGSNTEAGDEFGDAVSISNGTIAIGARTEASAATTIDGDQLDNSASGSGAVYVFAKIGGVWTQQAYLKASNNGPGDWFGFSVGVSDDTIVVGAIGEDGSAVGVDGPHDDLAPNSGAAYVFVRDGVTWTQQAYLKASNTDAGDAFARRVGVSGDRIVVGAHNESSDASGVGGDESDNSLLQAGAAYVYERVAGKWSHTAYLKASNPGAEDFFGWWVAVSGEHVVVGAYLEDSDATGIDGEQGDAMLTGSGSGAAYVFDLDAATIDGAGCPGEGSPTCASAPSASSGFTLECPSTGQTCLGGLAVIYGSCAPSPILVPPPLGCDACGLALAIVWGSGGDAFFVGPGLPFGFDFCVQCGCVATPKNGTGCVHLTGAIRVVVGA